MTVDLNNDDFHGALIEQFYPIALTNIYPFPHLSKVVVIVAKSDVTAAIGRLGENARRISGELGQNVEVMSEKEFLSTSTKAKRLLALVNGISSVSARRLVANGVFDVDDISCLEPSCLSQITGISLEQASAVIDDALN